MWYAVYDIQTGEAVSFGTVVAESLPEGLAAKEIGIGAPDFERQQWSKGSLQMVDIAEAE